MTDSEGLELLERVRQRDQYASGDLYQAYQPMVYLIIYRMAATESRFGDRKCFAEDATLAVFYRAIRHLERGRGNFANMRRFEKFLGKVARNYYIDEYRKEGRRLRTDRILLDEMIRTLTVPQDPMLDKLRHCLNNTKEFSPMDKKALLNGYDVGRETALKEAGIDEKPNIFFQRAIRKLRGCMHVYLRKKTSTGRSKRNRPKPNNELRLEEGGRA